MMDDTLGQILQALHFAAQKHRYQRRKDLDQTPYINHPIALVQLLYHEAGVTDPLVLMGAVLHDTVEDTDTTLAEIEMTFGEAVAAIVAQVTDDKTLPKATRKQHQIDHAATMCDRAKLVKIADKIHNLRDLAASPPAHWSPERQFAYCHWSKQVVDELRGVNTALEALFDQAYTVTYATCQSQSALDRVAE